MIDFGTRSTLPDPSDVGAALARLGGVFRSMPESRLSGRLPDGRPRAVAGYELAGAAARAAQGIAERSSARPPVWREVPYVGPFVVGDQLTVMAYELAAAVRELEGGDAGEAEVGARAGAEVGADVSVDVNVDVDADAGAVGGDASGAGREAAGGQVWAASGERMAVDVVLGELAERVRELSLAC